MKIIFFGSDDFAAESLKRLLAEPFDVMACVAPPDRPSGRGLQVIDSPIKAIAQDNKIPILQPENVREQEFLDQLKSYHADLFIVIAYGKILSPALLKIPKIFCINVHGSLLPKYRGAAPINWAIINGEKETGFSLIKMNSKMDAGEIIAQEKMIIGDEENSQSLRERMARASAECLCRTIKEITDGKIFLLAQDQSKVTFASKLNKELGLINWNKSAQEIHDLVRGLLPWPGAYTFYDGKMVKIIKTVIFNRSLSQKPGTILEMGKDGIVVATGKDAILLTLLHPQSGKIISAQAFAAGQRLQIGNGFG